MEDTDIVIGVSFLSSVIGGAGNGINNSSAVALFNSYKDKRQEYMNYFNVVNGVGFLLGPLVAGLLYPWGGYICPMLTNGTFFFFLILIFMFLTKGSGNELAVAQYKLTDNLIKNDSD